MGDVICKCNVEIELMKADILALKMHHQECEVWRESFQNDLKEIIELLHQVKSALQVFVKIGNAVKWVATVGGAAAGLLYFVRKVL